MKHARPGLPCAASVPVRPPAAASMLVRLSAVQEEQSKQGEGHPACSAVEGGRQWRSMVEGGSTPVEGVGPTGIGSERMILGLNQISGT